MATKLRLQRHGGKKRPFYFIVAAHTTVTRDGKFIEKLGTYNPLTVPATIELNRDRALYWLDNGAVPTDTVNRILSFKGVKFLKHLMRGVKLGLFDKETALAKFDKWNETHESDVSTRREAHKKAKHDIKVAAMAPIVKKVEEVAAPVVEEAAAAPIVEAAAAPVEEVAAPVVEEVAAPVVEEVAAPVVEEAAAPVVESTPASADDLKIVEGIGPKIADLFIAKGITTFAQLAATSEDDMKAILEEGGLSFNGKDPGTWAAQAKMAAEGKMDELKAWQDELNGGK